MSTPPETPIVLSVSQITWAIKNQLEKLFTNIWVKGEVTNYKQQASGHLYFTLMDEGAQIAAVMFKQDAISLPMPIKNGDTIIVRGDMNVYPQRGNYQILVRSVSFAGLGDQLIKLMQLKKKLEALGWTSPERKRKLPATIEKIVVVTSPTGAVLRDVYNVLTRRMAGFHLVVNPVRVQGESASREIAKAIRECSDHKLGHVLILCRGGGSAEDLSAFNDEEVARAIVECSIPVVSAVGHETDFTIADLVADLRAPTPSAAAELVSHEKAELMQRLKLLKQTIWKRYAARLLNLRQLLTRVTQQKAFSSIPTFIQNQSQRLDDIEESFKKLIKLRLNMKQKQLQQMTKVVQTLAPQVRLRQQREKLKSLDQSLGTRMHAILFQTKKTLKSREQQLSALNPFQVLQRGYAVVRRGKDQGVISSISNVHINDAIEIVLKDGKVLAEVKEVQ